MGRVLMHQSAAVKTRYTTISSLLAHAFDVAIMPSWKNRRLPPTSIAVGSQSTRSGRTQGAGMFPGAVIGTLPRAVCLMYTFSQDDGKEETTPTAHSTNFVPCLFLQITKGVDTVTLLHKVDSFRGAENATNPPCLQATPCTM